MIHQYKQGVDKVEISIYVCTYIIVTTTSLLQNGLQFSRVTAYAN